MGNGASSRVGSVITIDGDRIEVARLKLLYPELRSEIKKKDELISEQEKKINSYELELTNLKKEIRELKSVLEATVVKPKKYDSIPEGKELDVNSNVTSLTRTDSLRKFKEVITKVRNKRYAVSAESGKNSDTLNTDFKKIPKSSESRKLIGDAILKNNFLKHLEEAQVREIVLCMDLKTFKQGDDVIKEGDSGSALFVLNKGSLQVRQGEKVLGKPLGPGMLFGELAILYNCTRTASVRALEDVEVWSIERTIFQAVMKRTGTMRRDEHFLFLRSVGIFSGFSKDKLYKIGEVVAEEVFQEDEYIIREGERGDSFFIIMGGSVKVLQLVEGKDEPQEIRELNSGDYFGEKALFSEDLRTASIVANKGGANCLVIERDHFMSFIGDLEHIREKDYGDKARKAIALSRSSIPKVCAIRPEFQNKKVSDYQLVATLGMGGFGRVELVHEKANPDKTYALKYLIKKHVVETKQQEHVFNEKKILLELDSSFIVKLYRTFKDKKYVYLLMEVCLGGELWTILRDKDNFDEPTTKFYIACVVEAFDYLRSRRIVYRDLKPENLMMDSIGYVKLVDFGFAKKIENGGKTWTFCGTPEYVAPEIILNKGHDCSSDCWSLGILIYELMTGNPPFTSSDAMSTYNIILRGIDALEFSPLVTRNAQILIKKLCKDNPMERLGNQKDGFTDVRKHKWFQGFHWSGVRSRTLKPPIQPKIKGPLDNSNFDYFSPSKDSPPDENSGWDKDF